MKSIKNISVIIAICSLIVLFSCVEENKGKIVVKNTNGKKLNQNFNLNISILLDLSDRIDPIKHPNESMDFYKRDIGYIKSVSDAFDIHIRSKKIIKINDRIQLFFDPEPKNSEINSISNSLKYNLNKENITLALLSEISETYETEPGKIYDLAIHDKSYIGSNTWGFFKNKVSDYCIENNFRNILIVITDGYIYHEKNLINEKNLTTYIIPQTIRRNQLTSSNWRDKMNNENYGFIPLNIELSNLEILILGINPDPLNPYSEDIIRKYWGDWLTTMNVKRFEIKNADLPSNMDKIIKKFILNE